MERETEVHRDRELAEWGFESGASEPRAVVPNTVQ